MAEFSISRRDGGKYRIGKWGGYSLGIRRKHERLHEFGVFRVAWLGLTVVLIGPILVTLTRPVEFIAGAHRQ